MPKTKRRCRVSIGAKAAAAAIVSLGLFAWSPYTNEARAITDSAPNASNAMLAFSRFSVSFDLAGESAQLCADNYSEALVKALLVFDDGSNQQIEPVTIGPNNYECAIYQRAGINSLRAFIILQSPTQCSQAAEYPGKCRVLGSVEIFAGDNLSAHKHLEPVLLTAIPALPRINPVPLPQ